jgi:hypothetical protein
MDQYNNATIWGWHNDWVFSDRENFLINENHPQNNPATQQVVFKDKKENSAVSINNNPAIINNEITSLNPDSVKKTNRIPKKINGGD